MTIDGAAAFVSRRAAPLATYAVDMARVCARGRSTQRCELRLQPLQTSPAGVRLSNPPTVSDPRVRLDYYSFYIYYEVHCLDIRHYSLVSRVLIYLQSLKSRRTPLASNTRRAKHSAHAHQLLVAAS